MEHTALFARRLAIAFLGFVSIGRAAVLPGLGEVSGTLTGPPPGTIVPVYLFNKELNVGYGVFAVPAGMGTE